METLQATITEDPFVTGIVVLGGGLLVVTAAGLVFKSSRLVKQIKNKIMWNSIFRSQIQTFLTTVVLTLNSVKNILEAQSPSSDINGRALQNQQLAPITTAEISQAALKCSIFLALPTFSFYFLRKKANQLDSEEMKISYLTLYNNLRTKKPSTHLHTSFFCARRIIIGAFTVFVGWSPLANIIVNIYVSIAMLGYLVSFKPLITPTLNKIEIMNDIFMVLCSYALILFTDFVPDVEVKYTLGAIFTGIIGFILLINLSIILKSMIRSFALKYLHSR